MASFNRVILMGNLVRDPDIKYNPNGTAVATFSLAMNSKYRRGDETKEKVDYVDIVVFGKTAENCGQYLKKGAGVLVEGRLNQRRWETDDGQGRSKHEVQAASVNFLPRRGHSDDAVDEGDIPF